MAAMGIKNPDSLPVRNRTQDTQEANDTMMDVEEQSQLHGEGEQSQQAGEPEFKRSRSFHRKSAPDAGQLRTSIRACKTGTGRQSLGGVRTALQSMSANKVARKSLNVEFAKVTKTPSKNTVVAEETYANEDESTFDGSELFAGTQACVDLGLGLNE